MGNRRRVVERFGSIKCNGFGPLFVWGVAAVQHALRTVRFDPLPVPARYAERDCAMQNPALRKLLFEPLFRSDRLGDSVATTERQVRPTTPRVAA